MSDASDLHRTWTASTVGPAATATGEVGGSARSPRSVGFRQSVTEAPERDGPPGLHAPHNSNFATTKGALPTSRPTPLPKRPKGRMFAAVVVLATITFLGHFVWDAYFRYQAYGSVVGRVVDVPAAHGGFVQVLHVREGDIVEPGQLLITLTNLELSQRLDRISDELKIAQADLEKAAYDVKLQARHYIEHSLLAMTRYYDLRGEREENESLLEDLELQLQRKEKINRIREGAISRKELDSIRLRVEGKRQKILNMSIAVKTLQEELAKLAPQDAFPNLLEPKLARIESLQAEMRRLRELLTQCEIRAPVGGRIVKSHMFAGEYAEPNASLIRILEEDSVATVIYMPQHLADNLQVGDILDLQIDPMEQRVPVKITRLGDRLETVPLNLQRYYRSNERLLPVYGRPLDDELRVGVLRLGSEVRLPKGWTNRRLARGKH